jgi:hypothetical protein
MIFRYVWKNVFNGHQKAGYGRLVKDKDGNLKREPWDSSTEKAKTLTLADFGNIDEVRKGAKPVRSAASRKYATEALKEIARKGLLTNKAGFKARLSGKGIGKFVSNQAINTSFSAEAHYLATVNIDYLFINSIELWKFELNPNKNNDGLKERRYFYAPLEYEGSIIIVKITVKEYIDNRLENKLYSIEAIKA